MNDEIKIRKTWPNNNDFDPSTKAETPKVKKHNRSAEKQNLKKVLRNVDWTDEEALDDLDI